MIVGTLKVIIFFLVIIACVLGAIKAMNVHNEALGFLLIIVGLGIGLIVPKTKFLKLE